MNNEEGIDKLHEFCDKYYTHTLFGTHFTNQKAAAIASAISYKGCSLTQYDGKDGQHALYVDGKLFQLFTR